MGAWGELVRGDRASQVRSVKEEAKALRLLGKRDFDVDQLDQDMEAVIQAPVAPVSSGVRDHENRIERWVQGRVGVR